MRLNLSKKIGIGFSLIIFLGVLTGAWFFYARSMDLLRDQWQTHTSAKIDFSHSRLQLLMANWDEDLHYLSRILNKTDLAGSGQVLDTALTNAALRPFESHLIEFIRHRQSYLSIRLIDKEGMEVVAVGRQGEKILNPPGGVLQNKSHRDYVRNTLLLSRDAVYISPINLNREHGKVSLPRQIVMRYAMPLFLPDTGEAAGLISITADMSSTLKSIAEPVQSSDSTVFITNDSGDFLIHPDERLTFGFERGETYRIQDSYPEITSLFDERKTVNQLTLALNRDGESMVMMIKKLFLTPESGNQFITVALIQPENSFLKRDQAAIRNVLLLALLLAIAGAGLGVFAARSLTKHLESMTRAANEFISNGKISTKLPVHRQDEIGVLSNAFEYLIEQVNQAHQFLISSNQELESQVKARTRAIVENQSRLQAVMENMVDGLILINSKGIIQSFNWAAENIFGYNTDEVLGQNVKMLMPEPYHSEHDGYVLNYLDTGEKKIIGIGREVQGVRKDGSVFPLDLAVSEVILDGEKMFSGIVRDITERKQIDQMKNEFISTVSHELRTPLTAIRGSLGLLSGGVIGQLPDKATELLTIANNNTERLLLLINDILDIQKIEAGQMIFRFKPLPLKTFLEQAIKDNATYADHYGVKFLLTEANETTTINADKDRMAQVMANLLSNAAKFSAEGQTVEIAVIERDNRLVRISVTDHGIGIPEEFKPRIFDKFTQSDGSDSRQKGGTGLGLSISRTIVEKHGGKMHFVSSQGKGTTFMVDFPLMADFPPTANTRSKT